MLVEDICKHVKDPSLGKTAEYQKGQGMSGWARQLHPLAELVFGEWCEAAPPMTLPNATLGALGSGLRRGGGPGAEALCKIHHYIIFLKDLSHPVFVSTKDSQYCLKKKSVMFNLQIITKG